MSDKPRLGVFKFASCDGCQLTLLSVEDELLNLAGAVDIAYFLEASSRIEPGPYDIALVEGSITTREDARRIQQIREDSRVLVTIGACATSGGIQALRNWNDCEEFVSAVYARPDYISTLETSTAIADHVQVDFELRGCPVDPQQLIDVVKSYALGWKPRTSVVSVCQECKMRGNVCVAVAQGIPCLGPVTQAGCGAICPSFLRGCYGCFGPAEQPNLVSLGHQLHGGGMDVDEIRNSLRMFNGNATEFRRACDNLHDLEGK